MTSQFTPESADAESVRRAQGGELDAFEALTHRYEQRVYSLALRMLRHEQDAEDVTQQTFLSVIENLGGFRGDAAFATWLLRIATHAALKVIRKQKGLDTVSLEEMTEPAFLRTEWTSSGELAERAEKQRYPEAGIFPEQLPMPGRHRRSMRRRPGKRRAPSGG